MINTVTIFFDSSEDAERYFKRFNGITGANKIELDNDYIAQLKAELKREREAVDFYANPESWSWLNNNRRTMMKLGEDLYHNENFTSMTAGKLARETQQQRKVEL